jgi:hypothetical protein
VRVKHDQHRPAPQNPSFPHTQTLLSPTNDRNQPLVTVNVSRISPGPVNLTLNGAAVPGAAPLLRPLVKVFGSKTAELDGTPSSKAYDKVAAHSASTWISKYIPLAADGAYNAEQVLSFPLSSDLEEGYYTVSSTISLITSYPQLTDLTGLNQITQDDESGTSSGVTGLWEAATWQIHNGTVIGVQKLSTPTTLGTISCTSHLGTQAVKAGDKVVLAWRFSGIGSATCTHDGMVASNAPASKCVSPLTVTARAMSTAATRHAVVVTFTDVCGRARTAEFAYTEAGVVAVTPTEVLAADGTIQIVARPDVAARGAAGGAARGIAAAVGAAAAATALLLL